MSWAVLAPILLNLLSQYGPEVVAAIAGLFSSPTAPTQAQWDALTALSKNTAKSNMLAALWRRGSTQRRRKARRSWHSLHDRCIRDSELGAAFCLACGLH